MKSKWCLRGSSTSNGSILFSQLPFWPTSHSRNTLLALATAAPWGTDMPTMLLTPLAGPPKDNCSSTRGETVWISNHSMVYILSLLISTFQSLRIQQQTTVLNKCLKKQVLKAGHKCVKTSEEGQVWLNTQNVARRMRLWEQNIGYLLSLL